MLSLGNLVPSNCVNTQFSSKEQIQDLATKVLILYAFRENNIQSIQYLLGVVGISELDWYKDRDFIHALIDLHNQHVIAVDPCLTDLLTRIFTNDHLHSAQLQLLVPFNECMTLLQKNLEMLLNEK